MNRLLSAKISLTALACALGAVWLAAPADAQTGNTPAGILSGSAFVPASGFVLLDAQGDYDAGVAKYKAGDYAAAADLFSRSIKARPLFNDAYYNIGLSYYYLGQYDKAVENLTRYTTKSPKVADGFLSLGDAYAGAKKYQPAIEAYSKALDLKPKSVTTLPAYTGRGDANYNLGNFDKAIADYTQYFSVAGTGANPVVYTNRALAKASKTPPDNAGAINDYNAYIAAKPNEADAYLQRGDAYAALKQYDKAAADYGKAVTLKPDEAAGYNGRALAYLQMTPPKYTEAIADYKAYIAKKPSQQELNVAYKNLGFAYTKAGDSANAIDAYTKLLAAVPNDKEALNARALAYIAKKDFAKANADYSAYIAANPGDATAYFNRGVGYTNQKEYQKAADDFTKAIEIKNTDTESYAARAKAYEQLNKYAEAAKDYSTVLAAKPGDDQTLYNRGLMYYKAGDKTSAKTDLAAYDAKKPGNATVAEILAAISASGGGADALAAQKRLADLKPNDPLAQYNYGVFLYQAKDYPGAITALGKAITLNGRDEVALYTRALAYFDSAASKTDEAAKTPLWQKSVADTTAALAIKPDYKDALQLKGDADFALKAYPAAIADYNKYLALPGSASDKVTLARVADAYIGNKDYAGAETAINKLVAADPTNTGAMKQLAVIQLKAKPPKFAEAQATLTKYLAANPNDAEAQSNLGYAYANMPKPDYEKAAQAYEKANGIKTDATTILQAGYAYKSLADADAKADTSESGAKKAAAEYDKAIAAFEKSAGIKPTTDAYLNAGLCYAAKAETLGDDTQYKGAIAAMDKYLMMAPATDPNVPKVKAAVADWKAKTGG